VAWLHPQKFVASHSVPQRVCLVSGSAPPATLRSSFKLKVAMVIVSSVSRFLLYLLQPSSSTRRSDVGGYCDFSVIAASRGVPISHTRFFRVGTRPVAAISQHRRRHLVGSDVVLYAGDARECCADPVRQQDELHLRAIDRED
jgi:hypothetical protein